LFLATSGRVQLWIAGVAVIQHWEWHANVVEEYAGTTAIPPAVWQDLDIDFQQAEGALSATLLYASASQGKAVVPIDALRHLP
jgi:hypothetical protein